MGLFPKLGDLACAVAGLNQQKGLPMVSPKREWRLVCMSLVLLRSCVMTEARRDLEVRHRNLSQLSWRICLKRVIYKATF